MSSENTPLDPAGTAAKTANWRNLPNLITLSRLILSFVLFYLMDQDGWWRLSAVVFVVAAGTDFLDGYLARKYGQVTVLGRILDPFVDKIIICGAFIFLLGKDHCGITPWITFTVIAREMFVTSLRSFLEQDGRDFSAQFWGKLKMVLQCGTVPMCLLSVSPDFRQWIEGVIGFARYEVIRDGMVWAMVAITVWSGIEYTYRAYQILRRPKT